MTERFRMSLSGMWLLVSLFSFVLPVFLPSSFGSANPAANVIGTATVTMFILSFPSSLFGIPLIFIVDNVLGIEPNSMSGMYANLFMLFVLGAVQWFWIVPRVRRSEPAIEVLRSRLGGSPMPLSGSSAADEFEFFRSDDQTPLEKVLNEDE